VYFKQKYSRAVWVVSTTVALIVFSLFIIQGKYWPQYPYIIPLNMTMNYAFVFCLLIAITPPSIIELNNSRWLKQVDKNIPQLMMDVTESIRSGMPMIRALEIASKRNYGPISGILETAVVNFNLTSDLEGSLTWFGESLLRPSGRRMATILLEANDAGGRMMDVLETSIYMFTSIDEYKDEKQSNISPYILLVYVSSLIFLFIGWVVIAQFLEPLSKQNVDVPGAASLIGTMLDINYYKSIVFWAAIVEGMVGGLVAGKITDSKIASGLIHSVFLVVITISFYKIFLP
jgi:flagellar protein FlaJ